ncbi:MAG: nicotinate phosphoribosyltransferase, partial [Bacteroidota bacterium]
PDCLDRRVLHHDNQGFHPSFLDYLSTFEFKGTILSATEGELIFPNEPVLSVRGNLIESQIIETLLLNTINFESLIATKASRICYAAKGKSILDFGLRRAQGWGGLQASKAAIIGGVQGTSNVLSGMQEDIPVSGTMAHSWIQSFEDELTAFRAYARHYPDDTVLLVDTYNTLESGIPNAIQVAHELERASHRLKAIRLDSGDLAYLSKKARTMLDEAGLSYVGIAASNQLDEHLIRSLDEQEAPIDFFGVGTKLVTAYDHPALDGVYKLSEVNGEAKLKISDNVEKITLPGVKNVTRYYGGDGMMICDGISLASETEHHTIHHPLYPAKFTNVSAYQPESLLKLVVDRGRRIANLPTALQSQAYASKQLARLNPEHKRFDNPHVYKVGVSKPLIELRDNLITSFS